MKISYALNVLNGEPFIWYQLNSLYKHAHEIIIVEGAYKKFSHGAENYRSIDNTVNIIKNYPDSNEKIKLITRDYYYDDRLGMCNEFMEEITGDILWQIDVDEFYSDETHIYVKKLFSENDNLDQISFNFFDYYAGFDFIIEGYHHSLQDVIRVNRIFDGMRWTSQRPPTLELNGNLMLPRKKINGIQMGEDGHFMHNATMLFDKQVQDKFKYYADMWPTSVMGSQNWFDCSWKNFDVKFCVAGMKDVLTYLVLRSIPLPESLNQMKDDINNGSHPRFLFSSNKVKSKILEDIHYEKKIKIAKDINIMLDCSSIYFIKITINIIKSLFYLPDSHDKKIMISIFIKNIERRIYYYIRIKASFIFNIVNKLRRA